LDGQEVHLSDYRGAIAACLRSYQHMPDVLIKTLVTVIETAVDAERTRLRAEAKAERYTCAKCGQGCRECDQALEAVAAEIAAASAKPAPAIDLGQLTPDMLAALQALAARTAASDPPQVAGMTSDQLPGGMVAEPVLTKRQAAQRARRDREKRQASS
jgi:hypothetical protein